MCKLSGVSVPATGCDLHSGIQRLGIFLVRDETGLPIHERCCRLRVFDSTDQRFGLIPNSLDPGLDIGFVVVDVIRRGCLVQIYTHEAGAHFGNQLFIGILRRTKKATHISV